MANEKHKIMARRRTYDGVAVLFWTDGGVTLGMGFRIRGIGERRQSALRSAYADALEVRRDVEAAWLLAGEVEVYDAAELRRAIRVARQATRQRYFPALEYFRRRMAGDSPRYSANAMGSVGAVSWRKAAGAPVTPANNQSTVPACTARVHALHSDHASELR